MVYTSDVIRKIKVIKNIHEETKTIYSLDSSVIRSGAIRLFNSKYINSKKLYNYTIRNQLLKDEFLSDNYVVFDGVKNELYDVLYLYSQRYFKIKNMSKFSSKKIKSIEDFIDSYGDLLSSLKQIDFLDFIDNKVQKNIVYQTNGIIKMLSKKNYSNSKKVPSVIDILQVVHGIQIAKFSENQVNILSRDYDLDSTYDFLRKSNGIGNILKVKNIDNFNLYNLGRKNEKIRLMTKDKILYFN